MLSLFQVQIVTFSSPYIFSVSGTTPIRTRPSTSSTSSGRRTRSSKTSSNRISTTATVAPTKAPIDTFLFIFGDDGEDDNDIDAANPESGDDSENLEDNNDVNGDDDNLEDDDLDNDTDSENDDLPDDSPTESVDEIEKRKTLINNMIALYNILSGSIDLLESYTSSTELSSDESTTLFNILANLTESKNILYKEITNGFTNKTYVELVKTYVGINNVYDLCTEILNKHFDNLELQLQKTHPARSKRSRKK